MAKKSGAKLLKAAKKGTGKKTASKSGAAMKAATSAIGGGIASKLSGAAGKLMGGKRGARGASKRSPISSVKNQIKNALIRSARYQIRMGRPMGAAKTLRKRYRVI